MSAEGALLDANVLAYAINADSPHHAASRALLEAARHPSITLYVTSQVLCELYSVITNPRRVAEPCSPTVALQIISALMAPPGMQVLSSPASAVTKWMELVERRPVTGGDIFDLQLVATMLANSIKRIYTFNVADFAMFSELSVVLPAAQLEQEQGS